ncbi:MAG: YkgJ family cysteine cluster protein [Bacillota bacterium]|nr:YkgJ family cysteine cluster protein [Bacillota bacterium]
MDKKIKVFLIQFNDSFLGNSLGCDLDILDSRASVADLMDALDAFALEHMEDCKGCDGCCRERAPLIAADIPRLAELLPPTAFPAHQVCEAFAELQVKRGISDIFFRRDKKSGACIHLDSAGHCCKIWPQRAFVCRSHFCLPRSEKIERLRQDITNSGINELTRLLLAEEAIGASPLGGHPLEKLLKATDYEENPQRGLSDYGQILIRDCVSPELWAELYKPEAGSL